LLCRECPNKPFCSALCPEAELFATQDKTARREYFLFSQPKYRKPSEQLFPPFQLTKKEWQILTLLEKGLTRKEICKVLGISRDNLRVRLSLLRSKFNGSWRRAHKQFQQKIRGVLGDEDSTPA
jgi:DNA-binding CsgD family transcriptional regulator